MSMFNWLLSLFRKKKPAPKPVLIPTPMSVPPVGDAIPSLERRLLDFIGDLESPAGYNQRYGEIVPAMDLSQMTIGDVLLMQEMQQMRGAVSTATGRYQFIRKTLMGLVDKLDIPLDRYFDPMLQDQLATELLRQRGIEKFKAGKMSLEAFGNNLAREWASLPILTPINGKRVGQSYYAGDSINHALTTPEAVRAALST